MSKDNGGPAFPSHGNFGEVCHEGMTLRDYFAAKALEAIIRQLDKGIRPQDCIRAAEDAYFLADSMLKARDAQ